MLVTPSLTTSHSIWRLCPFNV